MTDHHLPRRAALLAASPLAAAMASAAKGHAVSSETAQSKLFFPVATQVAPVVTRNEIAPGVHQFTTDDDGYVEQLNSVAIITDRGVVVFDTNTRPSTARYIIGEIRKLTPQPVRYIVNSHWHPDHWSGNQAYAEAFPGVEIIATEKTRDYMMNVSPQWRMSMPRALARVTKRINDETASGKTADGAVLTEVQRRQNPIDLAKLTDLAGELMALTRTFPTLTYTDQLTLRLGGREFLFISVTGDAKGATVLYLPNEKVLMTGDVVSYPLPYFTPPLADHARTLRELARLDADIVVPGHGPAFRDKAYMTLEAELFEEVERQMTALLRGGKVNTLAEAQAALNVDAFRERFTRGDARYDPTWPDFAKGMARRAYLEARDTQELN